jgi:hypothetical protein
VIARLVALALLLVPAPAWACATCIGSAYGDRTFNWAYFGLLLMPFVVGVGIAAVFGTLYCSAHWRARSSRRALGAAQLAPHEESSL